MNAKELEFTDPVKTVLEIGGFIIIHCSPTYSNKEKWDASWKKNDHKNVFVFDQTGNQIWTFNKPATGISSVDSFWIKPLEKVKTDSSFWITTSNFAYLISTDDFDVIQEVNTYILK